MKIVTVKPKFTREPYKEGVNKFVLIQKPTYGGFRIFSSNPKDVNSGINYPDKESLLNDFDIVSGTKKVYDEEIKKWVQVHRSKEEIESTLTTYQEDLSTLERNPMKA